MKKKIKKTLITTKKKPGKTKIMYNAYVNYLEKTPHSELLNDFKSNGHYNGILEHVSTDDGQRYLNLIITEFPWISREDIIKFCEINDAVGKPKTHSYWLTGVKFSCSPTSLRYIYHALTIMDYYQTTACKRIVEVGCGYGGLCLAINFFSRCFETQPQIDQYNIIDLPDAGKLIYSYLQKQSSNVKNLVHIPVDIKSANHYGDDIVVQDDSPIFFISNYCYTEIAVEHNTAYTQRLLPKCTNGFLVWQNGGNNRAYPVVNAGQILNKPVKKVFEEKPVGMDIYKNFFVYF